MKSFLALVLSLSFCAFGAKAEEAIHASDQFVDKQSEYKEAFERAQTYHEQALRRLRFEKPATIEEQQISVIQSIKLSTTETRNYLQNFWSDLRSKPVVESVRNAWKKFSGTLSTPPVATGLFYIFNTAGTVPEVLWIPDGAYDPDGTIDRFEFDFGDGTSQIIPYADFDSAKTVSHVYAANGTYNASVKIVDNNGDFSMYYGSVTVVSNNQLPVPKFAMQYNQVPNFLKLDLTSQATDDAGIIRHTWRFGDGSPDSIGTANTSVSRTYTNPGMYLIQYVVRDSHRGQITGWTHAYVGQPQPPGGSYPVPLIYADTHAGVAPLQVNFDGEKSFDVGGSIVSYEWNFGDFSHPKNISYQAKPSFRYMQPGTYYGSLKVTDNGGRFNTRYFAVYVSPAAPNTLEPAEITVIPNAAARSFSFDSNYRSIHASVPSYYQIWDFGDGTPIVKGNYPTHVYGSEGTYTVTLRVYDVKGGFQQIQKNLVVGSNQSSPTSNFYADNPNTKVLTPVNFITSNPTWVSPTTTAKWSFGDGTVQTGLHKDLLNVSHTYSQKGFYPVDLVVTDEFGKSSYYTAYVNIQSANQPIHPVIDLSARAGKIPLPIRFDARESTSSAGPIVNYYWHIWTQSGVQTSQNSVWTNTYTTGGERYVNLYIEDNQGNSGWATDIFAAIDPAQVPAGNQNPVANIQLDFSFNGASTMIHPSGWFSSDPDGDRIVSYEWILDGSPVSSKPNFSYNLSGTSQHLLALRVNDQWGAIGEKKISFRSPQVNFDYAPIKPIFSEPIYFTADEQTMTLPDSQAVSFAWDFGDGSVVQSGQVVNHTYSVAGTYGVRLTVTDNLQRKYYILKTLEAFNPNSFAAVISGKTADGVDSGRSGGTLTSTRFPETINFDLSQSEVLGDGIKSATWDFGDGNMGYGLNPDYSYQQPGLYTVTVNAIDAQNNASASSMQIRIKDWECSDSDSVNGCLKLINTHGNVFPMNVANWIVTHDKGGGLVWTPDPGDTSYIYLVPLEGEVLPAINITSAVILSGQNILIQKSILESMNLDFSKSYRLDVRTKLSDGSEYNGSFPKILFGIGTLNITSAENQTKIKIKGASGHTKYLDLGGALNGQILSLPVGKYFVSASKGDRSRNYEININNDDPQDLEIDLSSELLEDTEKIEKKSSSNIKDIKMFNVSRPSGFPYLAKLPNDGYRYDRCGNRAPFPLADSEEQQGDGIWRDYILSWQGLNTLTIPKVTKAYGGEELKISCNISSYINEYGYAKWYIKEEFARCGVSDNGGIAERDWQFYLGKSLPHLNIPINLQWNFTDAVTGKKVSGEYNTSLAQRMAENGVTLENITNKLGVKIPWESDLSYGFKFSPKISIPKNFIRPGLTLKLPVVPSELHPGYTVRCIVESEHGKLPRVLDVVQTDDAFSADMYTPEENGKRFLKEKFFPIGEDLDLFKPDFNLPDIFKARIKLKIDSGTRSPQDVEKIKIKVRYGAEDVGVYVYNLAPESYKDIKPNSSKFSVLLDMDARHFTSMVPWVNGYDKKLKFEFLPLGQSFLEQDTGGKIIGEITPLFNMKSRLNDFCKYGNYNPLKTSMYGAAKLMNDMYVLANNLGVNFRCNDASLPWGGLFVVPEPGHKRGHQKGINIDIRYFNAPTIQDNYDKDFAINRRLDAEKYLNLSYWAGVVAEAENDDETKLSVLDACKNNGAPVFPCTVATQVGDLTKDIILKLCQWHPSQMATVCSQGALGYMAAIVNYSTWVENNVRDLKVAKGKFPGIIMSGGGLWRINGHLNLQENLNWQERAIDQGKWPDGSPIYKLNGSSVSTSLIDVCHSSPAGCGLMELFRADDKAHIDHIHLQYSR